MERRRLSDEEVQQRLASLQGWQGTSAGLRKEFRFRDHVAAMGFVTKVALVAERMNHHPDLRIVYNRVEIALSTHDAGGVTEFDFGLAREIERCLEA